MSDAMAVVNIGQLVTLAGPKRARVGTELRELGLMENAALLVEDGCVTAVGPYTGLRAKIPPKTDVIDAVGCCVTPGFVRPATKGQ